MFIDAKTSTKDRVEIVKWAANNNYDALVFPLGEKLSVKSVYIKLAKRYELVIEAGGHDLSLLLPRRLFLFNRDLFRMVQGKRKKLCHFCPTNPKSTEIIKEQAQHLFARFMPIVTAPRIFHLLPDKGHETTWCACPACRAFSPAEQYIIAVNSAADALAQLDDEARLSFLDFDTEPEAPQLQSTGIAPRKNMFRIRV